MNLIEKKVQMEKDIQKTIREFEEDTGLRVMGIRMDRRFKNDVPINVYAEVELR